MINSAEQLPASEIKHPHPSTTAFMLAGSSSYCRAIQRPYSYFRLIKTQWYITLTNHTDNSQQKNTQQPQTCTHVAPPTPQLNASQKSSALQTDKLEVEEELASKGGEQSYMNCRDEQKACQPSPDKCYSTLIYCMSTSCDAYHFRYVALAAGKDGIY